MPNAPQQTARNIAGSVSGVLPFEQIGQMGQQGIGALMQLLQRLGLGGPQPPPINEPLPQWGGLDEQGNPIIIPPGGLRDRMVR